MYFIIIIIWTKRFYYQNGVTRTRHYVLTEVHGIKNRIGTVHSEYDIELYRYILFKFPYLFVTYNFFAKFNLYLLQISFKNKININFIPSFIIYSGLSLMHVIRIFPIYSASPLLSFNAQSKFRKCYFASRFLSRYTIHFVPCQTFYFW